MKRRLSYLAAVMLLVASAAYADKPSNHALSVPIGGNFVDATGATGTFAGTFKIVDFAVESGNLVAQGLPGRNADQLDRNRPRFRRPATIASGASATNVRAMDVHAAATTRCRQSARQPVVRRDEPAQRSRDARRHRQPSQSDPRNPQRTSRLICAIAQRP